MLASAHNVTKYLKICLALFAFSLNIVQQRENVCMAVSELLSQNNDNRLAILQSVSFSGDVWRLRYLFMCKLLWQQQIHVSA